MIFQIFHHFSRVFGVTLEPERQSLYALQQQKRIKRRNRRAGVAKQNRADIGCESGRTRRFDKGNSVVAGICLRNFGKLSAGLPVKFTGIHDHSAQSRTVPSDKFRSGMNDDIRSVFDRANQIRRSECIVDDQRQTVPVSDLSDGIDIRDIAVGIPQGFQIYRLRILLNRALYFREIMGVDESRTDSIMRQSVFQQIITASGKLSSALRYVRRPVPAPVSYM